MKSRLIYLLMMIAASASFAYGGTPTVGGMCWYAGGNKWIPISASVSGTGSSMQPTVGLTGMNGNQWYKTQCDASGNLIVSGISSQTTTFILNSSSTSTTANGSQQFPFQTLDHLFAGVSAYVAGGGTGPIAIWSNPSSSYSTANAITIPAIPITIYGNGSTWTFSAGVTNNALPFTRYDLTTVGTVTHGACASTARSESHGGGRSTSDEWWLADYCGGDSKRQPISSQFGINSAFDFWPHHAIWERHYVRKRNNDVSLFWSICDRSDILHTCSNLHRTFLDSVPQIHNRNPLFVHRDNRNDNLQCYSLLRHLVNR